MDITPFKKNIEKYSEYYTPSSLFDKIKKFAKKAGVKTVYLVLILYYALLDKDIPVKDRLMVIAALGYFILPIDIIPDALIGGFADDAAALLYVVKHIWKNISDETFRKARMKISEWFGKVEDSEIRI